MAAALPLSRPGLIIGLLCEKRCFSAAKGYEGGIFYLEMPPFSGTEVKNVSDYLQQLIADYEQHIFGNVYTFVLENGDILSFEIKKRNVPHLLGIGRLPLRQVSGKYAQEQYSMLKSGKITLNHVVSVPGHKEIYKKIMNFRHIITMLNSGEMVKVVKRIGSLNSSYLLYLDNQPTEIIHLGLAKDDAGNWYPESLLVLQRKVTAYIDNQLPVNIVARHIAKRVT